MPTEIILQSPLDMHIHFREGAMLDLVAPLSAETFAGGVIMPNLVPPVADLERLEWYTGEVRRAVGKHIFTPYMTLFFRNYSKADLAAVRESIIGIKLYPEGVTTNSEGGVKSDDARWDRENADVFAFERLGDGPYQLRRRIALAVGYWVGSTAGVIP